MAMEHNIGKSKAYITAFYSSLTPDQALNKRTWTKRNRDYAITSSQSRRVEALQFQEDFTEFGYHYSLSYGKYELSEATEARMLRDYSDGSVVEPDRIVLCHVLVEIYLDWLWENNAPKVRQALPQFRSINTSGAHSSQNHVLSRS
jgi:hypothetical protein